ncbi:MAG: hypothetical protein ACREC9_05515 [Methylocella sp.]
MIEDNEASRIRTILLRDWDPLIVGDNPNLSDEYDDLIPGIIGLLKNHCTAEQMERYLREIEDRWKSTPVKETSFVARRILEVVQDKA